jgi:hypothetical protein
MPNAGDYVRPVLLDKHSATAAIALLTAGQVYANVVLVDGQSGWDALDNDNQTLAVRFPGSYKTDHILPIKAG